MLPRLPFTSACAGGSWRRPAPWQAALAAVLVALVAGCASAPTPGSRQSSGVAAPISSQKDGPSADPPADLHLVPDAEPRVEPIRTSGPNKPYEVLGQQYTPITRDEPLTDSGLASWYGRKFHGRPTASGEIYDMHGMTAAHRTMPIPSYALVRNPANGREVVVRINDRGPFHRERVIDLSYTAALKLGVLSGVAPVEVQRLTHDDIRSGSWRAAPAQAQAMAQAMAMAMAMAQAQAVATPARPLADAPAAVASIEVPPTAAPGTGVAPLDVQAGSGVDMKTEPLPTPGATPRGFWLQFGAFNQRQGALELRQQLMRDFVWIEPLLAVFSELDIFKVQAGPYVSRGDAQAAAARIQRAVPAQPVLLQRR